MTKAGTKAGGRSPAKKPKGENAGAAAPRKGPRGSNVGSTYELLRHEIVSMQLRPGEVLDEKSLTKRLKLSRSPIREAIIRLASEGLVTVLPNRSTVVSTLDLQYVPKYLDALELTQRVVTRLAALNWTTEHMQKIKKHEAEFLKSLQEGDLGSMLSANYDYHMAIAAAADDLAGDPAGNGADDDVADPADTGQGRGPGQDLGGGLIHGVHLDLLAVRPAR